MQRADNAPLGEWAGFRARNRSRDTAFEEVCTRSVVSHYRQQSLAITVAVGTTIADRPPPRSVRARLRTRLLPRMSGGEANIRIGMQNAGLRNPPVQDGEQTPPAHLGALTATN